MGTLGGETRRPYAKRQKGTVWIEMILIPSTLDNEWKVQTLCSNPVLRATLEEMLGSFGISRAFVFMEETMNEMIATPSHFDPLGFPEKGARLYANYAVPAHGVFLNIHDAMVMATKNATCLMAYGDDKCVAVQEAASAHEVTSQGMPVIRKLVEELEGRAAHVGKMALCGFFGTSQKRESTFEHGRRNRFGAVAYEKVIDSIQDQSNHLVVAHRLS